MLNRITLVGRMVREPELRRTQNGTPVVSFSLAVERDFKDADGQRTADFVECVVWRSGAEYVANYGAKGRMMAVDGSLMSRKYQDKNGNQRTAWEVQARSVYFLDSRRDADERGATPGPQMEDAEDDGELPF